MFDPCHPLYLHRRKIQMRRKDCKRFNFKSTKTTMLGFSRSLIAQVPSTIRKTNSQANVALPNGILLVTAAAHACSFSAYEGLLRCIDLPSNNSAITLKESVQLNSLSIVIPPIFLNDPKLFYRCIHTSYHPNLSSILPHFSQHLKPTINSKPLKSA